MDKSIDTGNLTYEPEGVALVNFEDINTDFVKNYSDNDFLRSCRSLRMRNGWGLVAELLKRFKEKSGLDRGQI